MQVSVTRAPLPNVVGTGVAEVSQIDGMDVNTTAGQTFSGVVATFFDPHLSAATGNYTASIDWGDGGVSSGTITAEGNGNFDVVGSYAYQSVATFPIFVQVSGVADASLIAISNATVAEPPPTVAAPAAATLSDDGTTVSLSVLGGELSGESDLSYTWFATSGGGVTFAQNGDNDAKNNVATLTSAGNYTFHVVITDSSGDSVSSNVSLTVDQIETDVLATGPTADVAPAQTTQLSATTVDQFGDPMSTQPTFTWTMSSGPGSVDASSGLYTAPEVGPGSAIVQAAAGAFTDTTAITVSDSQPQITATAVSSSEIDLRFVAPAGHHIELEEQGPTDSNFSVVPIPAPTTVDNTLVYAMTGLTTDSQYSFRLRADLNGLASYSNTAQATPQAAADADPNAPAGHQP